jgi:hypothetical protein
VSSPFTESYITVLFGVGLAVYAMLFMGDQPSGVWQTLRAVAVGIGGLFIAVTLLALVSLERDKHQPPPVRVVAAPGPLPARCDLAGSIPNCEPIAAAGAVKTAPFKDTSTLDYGPHNPVTVQEVPNEYPSTGPTADQIRAAIDKAELARANYGVKVTGRALDAAYDRLHDTVQGKYSTRH